MRLLARLACIAVALASHPASAQWQQVSPTTTTDHTDFVIRDGVLVVSMSGSASRGLIRSVDGGATWTVPTLSTEGGTPGPFNEGVSALTSVADGFRGARSFRSDAAGETWIRTISPPPGLETFNVNRFSRDAGTGTRYATNYAPAVNAPALARSLDGGTTWTTMTGPFSRLSFLYARNDTLLAGAAVGGAYLSTDGGATWTDLAARGVVGAGVGGFIGPDGALYVNLAVGNFLGRTALWRSRDRGQTWTNLAAGISPAPPDTPNSRNGIVYVEGTRILFSAACQIYLSQDDGATWTLKNEGFAACTASGSSRGGVSQMAFDGGNLYVLRQQFLSGSQGADWGLYRRPASELGFTGAVAASETPDARSGVTLNVAPNPTAGRARLSLTLDAPRHVRASVVDLLGRDVLVVADGPMGGGTHAWPLDLSGLPAGVYAVRVVTPAGTVSHRLTVAR